MPDLTWNQHHWAGGYDWKTGGEEWSEVWGGSDPQWFGSLYPRLHRLLPTNAILEIAPGFGRWTKFLIPSCRNYLGIDLSGECVTACRSTFKEVDRAQFEENDGLSLDAAPDEHFDLVFSFDSLVHVEVDVMESYIPQILRKITPTGVAFLHHSNFASLGRKAKNDHARGASVSGQIVAKIIERAGGKVLLQEQINWGGPLLTDCLTLLGRQEHPGKGPTVHIKDARFMDEAFIIRDMQAPYSSIR